MTYYTIEVIDTLQYNDHVY